jgi:hypothetical protein
MLAYRELRTDRAGDEDEQLRGPVGPVMTAPAVGQRDQGKRAT